MAKLINENQLAKEITCEEGGLKSVNVAQVKEVLKIALKKLATYPPSAILALVEKHHPHGIPGLCTEEPPEANASDE